ncbi:MAG: Flp family type IVb pilin [Planctomycetes bacterium]|nr:Flp family type IVb pilin [Planctomycetota bacterium]
MALIKLATSFLKTESGPTATEYAVLLALIVVACLATIQIVGTGLNEALANASYTVVQ